MSMCAHFREFMAEQENLIKKSIEENKWYLSEKHGKDVGGTVAEQDFIDKHLMGVADKFRKEFCGIKCPDNFRCGWEKYFLKK